MAQSRAVARFAPQKYDILIIGGPSRNGEFPPGLNTQTETYNLRADETPDGYGFDISIDGAIKKNVTAPSGQARIAKTNGIATGSTTNIYYWYYNRLWRIDQTNLYYYAKFYDDILVEQRNSKIVFDEDLAHIKAICPYGRDSMVVAKTTGSYLLDNISDTRALMGRTDIKQELAVFDTNSIVELNGNVYVSNSNGVYALTEGRVVEISRDLRDNLVGVTNETLTVDYNKQYVITAGGMVYDVERERWFKYNGSSFRYTTRQFHLPDWAPFTVDSLLFVIRHDNEQDGYLKYKVKYEDNDWSTEFRVRLEYQPEQYTLVREDLQESRTVRKIQVQITDLSASKLLFQVRLDTSVVNVDDYVQ